ncbi:MAG: tetratricopeptide repeat protein, partial [Myxococcales bacterium]|nr:tetratricopeptide repeat protein [Myxococcales bacterium]
MHRVAASLGLSLALLACGAPPPPLPDPPRVEALRARITKARNAIAETRVALTRNRGTPQEVELWVRLAELIGEEARYHYQVAKVREGDAKALHVPQVRVLKGQAIGLYTRVVREWPASPQVPRALFNLGQEQRELGDYPAMRAALQTLVDEHPAHPLAAEALIVLGDDHFDRSDMAAAGAAYTRITQGPASRTVGLAFYKLGWVRVNQGDCPAALEAFEQAIDRTQALAGQPVEGATIDVRREALVDLVYCFSRQRPPEQAVPFLRAKAYSRDAYVAALERMADRFGVMDQALGALGVARELLDKGPDDEQRLDDARLLHGAVRKTERYGQVGADAERITAVVLRRLRRPGVPEELRARLSAEFEALVRDLATRAQEALFKGNPQGKVARAQALPVARAYLAHLDAFPEAASRLAVMQNLA